MTCKFLDSSNTGIMDSNPARGINEFQYFPISWLSSVGEEVLEELYP
jgi:hypothetical protein